MDIEKEIYNFESIVNMLVIIILSMSIVSTTFLLYRISKDIAAIRTCVERWDFLE